MASRIAKTVAEAVRASHRAGLEAIRDKLAADLDAAEPAVSAQIAGRLQAVLKELADMDTGEEVNPLDELANRRTRRESGADAAAPAGRQRRRKPG